MIIPMSVDYGTLPAQLLILAKQHLRLEGTHDDHFLHSTIARAIARFEQVNEVALNPTVVRWTAASADFVAGAINLPARPVRSFVATNDAEPPENVSASYIVAFKWDSIHGVPLQQLVGPAATLTLELTLGFETLPPAVVDVVLRHTAHLYEHREILIPGMEYRAPDLALDGSWWTPRL